MLIKKAINNAFDNFVDYVNNKQEMWNSAAAEFRYDITYFIGSLRYKTIHFFNNCFKMPFVRLKNYFICKRYPWLFINSGVYPWADRKYDEIWIDCMPCGWRKAFGWKLVKDLDKYLKENNITDYHIDQVKEKYGELRWYDNGDSALYNNVIRKYEDLSRKTCVNCGSPAKYMSLGWICPYCEKCKDKNKKYTKNSYYNEK